MKDIEICEVNCTNIKNINVIKEKMLDEEVFYEISDLFKLFSDSTRIKILWALSIKELCVCDIADSLGMTQSAISHQLRLLKQSKLVKFRKEGKIVYYSLDDEHVHSIFEQGLKHVGHTKKGENNCDEKI